MSSRKIAVCFSGYPRTWRHGIESQKAYFEGYDVDFFTHTWGGGNDWQDNDRYLYDFMKEYNPKLAIIEDRPDYSDFEKKVLTKFDPEKSSANMAYMAHGFHGADLLRRKHEVDHNVHYDLVVRARYDTKWEGHFGLIEPTMESNLTDIYFPEHANYWEGYNDQCCISGPSVMTQFTSVFHFLEDSLVLRYPKNMYVGELVLKWYVDWIGLRVNYRPIQYKILRPGQQNTPWDRIPYNDPVARARRIRHRIKRKDELLK